MSTPLETDYLVVGAGAMGLAFTDEILHGSKTARVIVVDRRTKPGGHWNDAHRFVTLHQPALYYGVNSKPLGAGGRRRTWRRSAGDSSRGGSHIGSRA